VKPADARQSDDLGVVRGSKSHRSAAWCIGDRRVDALLVVVVDVFAEQPSEMVFVQDDHVVEEFSAHAADYTLRGSVLPWAAEGCPLRVDLETLDRVSDGR